MEFIGFGLILSGHSSLGEQRASAELVRASGSDLGRSDPLGFAEICSNQICGELGTRFVVYWI